MRKVLILAASLKIGGAEKVARDIGLSARAAGYEIDYLVFGGEIGEYEAELCAHGCRIHRLPSPSNGYLRFFANLKRLINENRYDVIHAHTMFSIGWAMLAGRLFGVPVRISHAHSSLKEKRSIAVRIYETLMRLLILSCSTKLVACGAAAGERLYGKRAFRRRGQLVLNGIDIGSFAFDAAKRNEIRSGLGLADRFVIGHVGHLTYIKNQSYLLDLLPQVLQKRADVSLLLLGDGEDRQRLEEKARRLGVETRVILMGNVQNVRDYLSAMDVFAFPSLYEGMPLSLIEVQANGLPAVLSDRVPDDVFLTDLLTVLPLEKPAEWIDTICGAVRRQPESYAQKLLDAGLHVQSAMRKILDLYAG